MRRRITVTIKIDTKIAGKREQMGLSFESWRPCFYQGPFCIVGNEMVYYCECAHTVIHYGIKGKKVNNKFFFSKRTLF